MPSTETDTETTEVEAEVKGKAPAIPAIREFDNESTLITNVGFKRGSEDRYEILWMIPKDEEECQDRYGCPLSDLITAGVRNLSTRPPYQLVGFDEAGNLKAEGHEAMQQLADDYKPGQRAAGGPTQKAMAAKAKNAEAELGMSMEAMVEKMKALKEEGLID